jgi:fructokinase
MPKSSPTKQALIAAVEGGGTTFIVTIALVRTCETPNLTIPHTRFEILHQESILTTTPSETLDKTCNFFTKHRPQNGYDSLGICTFGPVGVNPKDTQHYGCILSGSPKRDWRNIDILSPILKACSSADGKRVPLYKVETDVNAPAMAEYEYWTRTNRSSSTASTTISSLAYITVGTGIGVGLVINGKPVHGMMHPEGGHVPVVPLGGDDFAYSWGDKSPFKGKNTVEGTASSVALTERLTLVSQLTESSAFQSTSREGLKDLSDDDPIWDHAANALANLCVTLSLVTSVEKIVFGGGIMNREVLYDKIRSRTKELLNGYLDLPQVTTEEGLKEYIGPSIWKEQGAGLVGALVLAQVALEEEDRKMELLEESMVSPRVKNTSYVKCPMTAIASYGSIFALGMLIGSRNKR